MNLTGKLERVKGQKAFYNILSGYTIMQSSGVQGFENELCFLVESGSGGRPMAGAYSG